ncbi:MAG: hypothetical protein LAQ69_16550 [Acidobacteriia bacterium]|nr:hypothetical protein [Terriglobia bacterium]
MYLTSTWKRGLVVGGVASLAAVALIGWTRKTELPVAPEQAVTNPTAMGNPEPVSRDMEPAGTNPNTPVVYAASPFAASEPAPVAPRVEPVPPGVAADQMAPAAAPDPAFENAVTTQPVVMRRQYYRSRRYYRSGRHRVVVRRRPFSHSVAIVAGSAAGGAIIGGLAGGGKGAGIGALAGGAGGLVYDRLTHKKKVVVR